MSQSAPDLKALIRSLNLKPRLVDEESPRYSMLVRARLGRICDGGNTYAALLRGSELAVLSPR